MVALLGLDTRGNFTRRLHAGRALDRGPVRLLPVLHARRDVRGAVVRGDAPRACPTSMRASPPATWRRVRLAARQHLAARPAAGPPPSWSTRASGEALNPAHFRAPPRGALPGLSGGLSRRSDEKGRRGVLFVVATDAARRAQAALRGGPLGAARLAGARFFAGRRRLGAAWPTLDLGAQRVDAGRSAPRRPSRRHAELLHRLGGALLEDPLELVPLLAGLGRDVAGHARHLAGDFADACSSAAPCVFFCRLMPSLTSASKTWRAFGLRLGERAHAGEPDLLRRFLDRARRARCRTGRRRMAACLSAIFLSFLTMCVSLRLRRGCDALRRRHYRSAPSARGAISSARAPMREAPRVSACAAPGRCGRMPPHRSSTPRRSSHAVFRHRRHRLHRQAPGQDAAGAHAARRCTSCCGRRAKARCRRCATTGASTRSARHAGVSATSPRKKLGVSADDVKELKGQVDHFYHLAAVYDLSADEESQVAVNIEGTRNTVEFAKAIDAGHFHHVSLDRRGRPVRRRVPRGHVRRGRGPRPPVLHDQAREREDRAQGVQGAVDGVPPGAGGRRLRRPARWTRSTARTTSSS